MLKNNSLRRAVVGAVATGAALGLAVLPLGGANAAVKGQYGAFGSSSASYTGATSGGTCDLARGSSSASTTPVQFNDGTKRRSLDLDATYASSDDPTGDRTRIKGHIDSKLTLNKKGRDLASFTLAAGGRLGLTHSSAHTSCQVSGSMAAGTQVLFTEHKTGWFYYSHKTTTPNVIVLAILVNYKTGKPVALDEYTGGASQLTARAKLRPGTYALYQAYLGMSVGEGFLPFITKSQAPGVTLDAARSKVVLDNYIKGVFKPIKRR